MLVVTSWLSLLTVCCVLVVVCCLSLFVGWCLLSTVFADVARCQLLLVVACWSLCAARRCSLSDVRCCSGLFVVCWLLLFGVC